MRCLKPLMVLALVGTCMAAATSVVAQAPSAVPNEAASQQKYNAAMVDALLAEGTPRSMVLAATSVLTIGQDAKANEQRKLDLLKQAAQMAPDDAWVQWFAALHADPAEILPEAALALQRLEPDNGAVWLFPLSAASRANDSVGVTEALARMGASRSFDDHFMAFTLEWLKFFRSHPIFLENIDDGEFAPAVQPLVMALARASALAMPNISSALRACKSVDQPLAAERREACLDAGRLIQSESRTLLFQGIGERMLRLAGAEDAAELARNKDYFSQKFGSISDSIFEDPQEFERYQSDLLKTGSEIQVLKNALTRAGIPLLPPADWKPEPNPYMETESKAPTN